MILVIEKTADKTADKTAQGSGSFLRLIYRKRIYPRSRETL